MSAENKALSRRTIEEIYNKGNLSIINEIYATDFINHSAPPGLTPDREGYKQFASMYRSAFPDLQMTVEDQIAEGDKVTTRWTATGTHKGELMGIAPTGKQVTVTGIAISRYAGGKLVEAWNEFDQANMLQQLGVLPPPGQN